MRTAVLSMPEPDHGSELQQWCRRLLEDPKVRAQIVKILRDADHPAFAKIFIAVADRAYGKPAQPLTGPDGGPIPVALIQDAVARVEGRNTGKSLPLKRPIISQKRRA